MLPNSEGVGGMVREFHEAFGLVIRDEATWPIEYREVGLRLALMREELDEVTEALRADAAPNLERALPAIAKELADLVYVVYGTALHYGVDLDAAVAEVHRSNMSKLVRCDFCRGSEQVYRCESCSSCVPYGGDPFPCGECGCLSATVEECAACDGRGSVVLLRDDGKVLKGPAYREPSPDVLVGRDVIRGDGDTR